jgi:hypothetical protein
MWIVKIIGAISLAISGTIILAAGQLLQVMIDIAVNTKGAAESTEKTLSLFQRMANPDPEPATRAAR